MAGVTPDASKPSELGETPSLMTQSVMTPEGQPRPNDVYKQTQLSKSTWVLLLGILVVLCNFDGGNALQFQPGSKYMP